MGFKPTRDVQRMLCAASCEMHEVRCHVVTVAAEDALSGGDGHGPTADHADCTEQEPCDWALLAVGQTGQASAAAAEQTDCSESQGKGKLSGGTQWSR